MDYMMLMLGRAWQKELLREAEAERRFRNAAVDRPGAWKQKLFVALDGIALAALLIAWVLAT